MGGAVSIGKAYGFDKAASTSVIPRVMPGTQGKNKAPLQTPPNGLKRKLTMRHTVRLDTEAAQRVQTMVLDMSRTGRVELTSTADHDEAGVPLGTLTKQNLVCLRHIPEMILSMPHLTELNLRCNEISELPKEIGELVALQVLVLSKNKLSEIPEKLTKLTKLRVLEITHNELTALPRSLGNLGALEVLLVSNNRIITIPDSISHCQHLRILNLYNNELTELENNISFLVELVELNASNNHITKMPKELLLWKNMRRLFLQVNQIASLPALDALSNLEVLQVQQNELETLPSMQDLVHLTKLDANNNGIIALPADSISDMTALVYLNLRNNKLTEIDPQLTQCLELEILDLGGNPIRSPIPNGLADLSKLRTLLLDGCNITEDFETVVHAEEAGSRLVTGLIIELKACHQTSGNSTPL
ncbi:hypothetical protein BBJ29_000606 [Phytophthora kernoviae]|uniref:Disease resistance R13L4/SHOC-2-like LRR domain-containing protein n=1 Tax=Phytophthora kernoviae TaxID=325452 RepID=A0A3F2S1H9_9STRA|nr:hypothetical protein BBJ29_000606 [Phytophthora kernoviae]RLN67616.1 hypothetical protein BBP00_00001507 [Phytophthora kernoviae]